MHSEEHKQEILDELEMYHSSIEQLKAEGEVDDMTMDELDALDERVCSIEEQVKGSEEPDEQIRMELDEVHDELTRFASA